MTPATFNIGYELEKNPNSTAVFNNVHTGVTASGKVWQWTLTHHRRTNISVIESDDNTTKSVVLENGTILATVSIDETDDNMFAMANIPEKFFSEWKLTEDDCTIDDIIDNLNKQIERLNELKALKKSDPNLAQMPIW